MPNHLIYHVLPSENNWKVELEGHGKTIKLFDNKEEAIEFATNLAQNARGLSQLKIHDIKGKIVEERTYGEDTLRFTG